MEKLNEKKYVGWTVILRILKRILFFAAVLLFVFLGALGLPVVQTFIAQRLAKSIQLQTGAHVTVGQVKISIFGDIHLHNFEVHDLKADTLLYLKDLTIGIDWMRLVDNELLIHRVELDSMVANISRPDSLDAFNYQFLMDFFATDGPKDDTASLPWLITINNTTLTNVRASYFDGVEQLHANATIGQLAVSNASVDAEQLSVKIGDLHLVDSKVKVVLLPNSLKNGSKKPESKEQLLDSISSTDSTIFSKWHISANTLGFDSVMLLYSNNNVLPTTKGIDYNHLGIDILSAHLGKVSMSPKGYFVRIDSLSLHEKNGWAIDELHVDAKLTNTDAQLTDLKLVTPNSTVKGNVSLVYNHIGALSNDFWNSGVSAQIEPSTIAATDVLVFAPLLADYGWFSSLAQNNVVFQGNVQGMMNDLAIDNLSVQGMKCTSVQSSLNVKGLPKVETILYRANIIELKSCLADLEALSGTKIDTEMHLPKNFRLSGNVNGTVKQGYLDGQLASSLGVVKANGFYQWEAPLGRDTFSVDFSTDNFRLDALMNDTVFGNVSMAGSAKGVGLTGNYLAAEGAVDVFGFDYAGYKYNQLKATVSIGGDSLIANVAGQDPNLLFYLDAGARWVDSAYVASFVMDLGNANFKALGFADDNFSISSKIHGDGQMHSVNQFVANLRMHGLKLMSDSLPILLDSINLQVKAMPNSFEANVKSALLDADFVSNISANELDDVIGYAYQTYLGAGDSTTTYADKNMALTMDVHLPQNVLQFFVPSIKKIEVKRIEGSYDGSNNALQLKVNVPQLIYSKLQFDTLTMAVNGIDDHLTLDFKLKSLVYDTLSVNKVHIEEVLHKGILNSAISIGDSASLPRYYFANELSLKPNGYKIRFKPNGLVLDGQPWEVDDSNAFEFDNLGVVANNFVFENNDQKVGLTTSDTNYNLRFTQFKVENLLDVVEQPNGKSLLKGHLNGVLELPFKGTNVLAELEIKDLCVMDSLVGNLYANVKTQGDTMVVDSRWESEPNAVDLSGIVTQLATSPYFDLRLLLDFKKLNRLEQFSFGQLSELGGAVNGDIALKGKSNDFAMNGFVGFDATSFTLNSLNFKAKINDEKVLIDPSGIHFNDFSVLDKHLKSLTLNGSVLTSDFVNYNYNLHIATKDFQPINSTIADNPLFFGQLEMDADVSLKGDMDNPKINADLKINKATNLTYRMPSSELKLVSSDGIVEFIDPTKVNDTLSIDLYDDILNDSILMKLKGLDLSLDLAVEDGATFRVDIDPSSGDYLSFSGRSALNLSSDITGKQSITGIYEVNEGIYQLSFYGMVKKSFGIVPGSTISWSGQPMDADLNINAAYEVRASSTALLSQEVTTMTEGEQNAYKQPLPYTVKLNIRGFLAQPEISFNLELPDKYLVSYPILANKLNVLNTPDMASELNKQVFSLLVAGSFMPSSPMPSSTSTTSGMVTTAARNSVNGLLASQLNNMSAKYVQGIDLDFGLTSYEDYTAGSGNTRTELDVQVSKKLMNDRLEVEAMGSFNFDSEKDKTASATTQQNTGEFAVSYLLTEDGVYKLRAYYQNAYDTFDGEYGYSGIALVFEREFDRSEKQLKRNAERVARKQLKKEKRGK